MPAIGELRRRIGDAARALASIGSDNPRMEAEHLAAHALDRTRTQLLSLPDHDPIPAATLERFDALVRRRQAREPLQYLLGSVPFCDLDLQVGPGVLIPRPETEVLVQRLLYWIRRVGWWERDPADPGTAPSSSLVPAAPPVPTGTARPWLVDVGTGSGAILLALLAELPGWGGIGVDRSEAALAYARTNALVNDRADGAVVGFACADLLTALAPPAPVERMVIVSNPPYIPTGDVPGLAPEVCRHEPSLALDGGPDGLQIVAELLRQARRVLAPGGLLALELGLGQAVVVETWLAAAGFETLERYRDLTGRERGVIARRERDS
ncbi:MAG: peptide chain release factor N(5)-glutamine methyltransferase [Candidatus Eisenbacteria bacterium]|uniref:Release factor glutamine methyltransferase n=1 Tax=Eiseniibacteriota bacterium TaxID=2212470 RepID=A0A956RQN6_UNCEI|nr:peptide chain release factor N(5)-glutamine methyltransferase [Candidatus Eisenbacteria bacterium]